MELAGRFVPQNELRPNFTLRLNTRTGGVAGDAPDASHLLNSDVSNLRRLASELECALNEDASTHSRRIGRRLR